MLRLVQKHRVDPDAIESIACDLKPYPLVRHTPQRGFEGRFSMAFCLAMALIQRRLAPNDFSDAHVHNERVQDLMRRTNHTPDAPALVVILKDGTRLEETLQHPTNLQGWEAVEEKFRNCVAEVLDGSAPQTVIDCVNRLEALASIQTLTKALQTKPIEAATKN
jgi:2-methylcitrate dehydratase PrpD